MSNVSAAPPRPPAVLTIAGVCFVRSGTAADRSDRAGAQLLTVRKRGTSRFMLPGGKLDPGETAENAAVREVSEEIGITLTTADLDLLGAFDEEAANEADTRIAATVYTAPLGGRPQVAGEIEALRWQPVSETPADVAPLLARHVLPALRARHLEAQHTVPGFPAG